jgi:hypothetical protein
MSKQRVRAAVVNSSSLNQAIEHTFIEQLEQRLMMSHFRGATMIPSVSSTGLLTLTSTTYWRPATSLPSSFPESGIDEANNPMVTGTSFSALMNDVGSDPDFPYFAARSIDHSDSRFTKITQQHTLQLPGPGMYEIRADDCCRVAGINNAIDGSIEMNSSIYWDGQHASTPINFSLNAVQTEVVRGLNYSRTLSAVPESGLNLSYDQALNSSITSQPPGFAVNSSTGLLSIPAANTLNYLDNSAGNVGADYAFSGNIYAKDTAGNLIGQVEFDNVFDAVDAPGHTPTVDDATISGSVGRSLTHTFTGSDPDGDPLTWSFVGLVGPGNASPAIAPTFNSSTQQFSWNTTGSVDGTWVAQVQASDGLRTDIGDLTITLSSRPTDVSTTKATTFDAKSVTVFYSIYQNALTAPLAFKVYRSDQPDSLSGEWSLVGSETIPTTDLTNLSVGNHQVTLLKGTALVPDVDRPYIVVVADPKGTIAEVNEGNNVNYFQTFMLGAIAHGFELPTQKGTPQWETEMAGDLQDHGYDAVIAFDWVSTSWLPLPGQATAAGDKLYSQIVSRADQLAASHAGDVVDLHFVGHSRGAVVISRAMQDLVARQTTDLALKGSYIKATFLDPHPANKSTILLASSDPRPFVALALRSPLLAGVYATPLALYAVVSAAANDPQVVISSNDHYAEVYYQHTSYLSFGALSLSRYLNLWGEGPSGGIINNSATTIHWHNLTGVDAVIGPIGHEQVHIWYATNVVKAGLAALV